MKLNVKMVFIYICCVAGIIIFGALSWNTLNIIKINGYYYQKISQDKEIIADVLPPRQYIVESWSLMHHMRHVNDKASLINLIQEFHRSQQEYQERHDYWKNTLPDSKMKEELIVASYKPAKEFFETADKEYFPALLQGNREKCEYLEETILIPKFFEHRQAIDRVVVMANIALKEQESAAHHFTQDRTIWLLLLGLGNIFLTLLAGFVWRSTEMKLLQESTEVVKESEKRFQDIAENAAEWVWEVDSQGKYTYSSPVVEQLLGYRPEEMLDKYFYDLFLPEEREEHKEKTLAVFAAGQKFREYVNRNLHKDGSLVWLSASGVPIFDKAGNLLGYRGADTDITARQKSLLRFKQISKMNEDLILAPRFMERLKRVTDGVVEIFEADFARIWILKPGDLCDSGCPHAPSQEGPAHCRSRKGCLHLVASSGRYTDINRASHRRVPLGAFKIGRIAAGDISRFLTNDVTHDPEIHDREWARGLGLVAFAGYRLLAADNTVLGVLALFSKHPISPEEDVMLEGIAATCNQLILMGKAEEGLRESEQRFRGLLENAMDGILLADIDTKKIYTGNKMISEMLGYSPDEISKLRVMDIHPEEDLPYVMEQFDQQAKQVIAVARELPVKRKDGSVFYADVNAFPIIIEGKSYLMGIFRDVTARRQAEQDLKESNAKLGVMVLEANGRNRDATLIAGMVEALQSCLSAEEAYPIIAHSTQHLFTLSSGDLFMLEPTSNLMELVSQWGIPLMGESAFPPDNCWALRRNRVHISDGAFRDEGRCRHLSYSKEESSVCIPLSSPGEAFGLLHVQIADEVDPVRVDRVKHVAVTLGDSISLALANIRLRETLRHQVIHDPLTGLFNRRCMSETLKREIHRARRKKAALGVIMLDLDHFKRFNDTYGHEAGDSLLETLGKFLGTRVRQEDVACRYDGEEFVLILPDASLDITRERAEEIRQEISQLQVSHRGRVLEMTTVSLGIAGFPEHGDNEEDLLRAADIAMYRAKEQGRNRVVVAERRS